MTPAEKRFWRLLADLTSEAKVLGDGGERLAAAFQEVVLALEAKAEPQIIPAHTNVCQ